MRLLPAYIGYAHGEEEEATTVREVELYCKTFWRSCFVALGSATTGPGPAPALGAGLL